LQGGDSVLDLPTWAVKFMRRVMGLQPGRYMILLTVGDDRDWTVARIGKVERG
jgi:hypothetical protein